MPTKNMHELLRRWLLAAACFLLLVFFFSPSWGAFRLWSRVPEMGAMLEVRRGAATLEQLSHPGAPIADPLHAAIQWRLLIPLVGHLLHLPSPVFFALADLGCLLVLAYLVTLLRRQNLGWLDCALATVVLGAASWFFTSTGWLGYWDSWFALALLIAAFSESRFAVWGAFLWAPWIDERFVVAAPLALLCRHLWLAPAGAISPSKPDWRREWLVPTALTALFLVVRLGVLAPSSAAGATPGGYFAGRHFLSAPLPRILLGVWEGLRAGWVFVLAAIVLLRPRRIFGVPWGAVVGGVTLLLVFLGLATAQDYSRSITMVLPVAALGALLLARSTVTWRRPTLLAATGAALLLPAHHVMNDAVNPIFYLYHELAALQHPPPGAMPELYELRAIHEMERGQAQSAETDLTLAIKLSDNPASAARQRGILRASHGRWKDALDDFATAVEAEPKNPENWFLRAQASFSTGDFAAAHADLDHALSIAPAGWAQRPDVARFLAKLNRAP